MKFAIAFVLAGLAMSQGASATVYKCETSSKSIVILAAIETDSGLLLREEQGVFNPMAGQVEVKRMYDGGPIAVLLRPEIPTVDWERERSCYILAGIHLKLVIHESHGQDLGSRLTSTPVIVRNPNRPNCSVPKFLIEPQALVCSRYKSE